MRESDQFYVGNAATDSVDGSSWFVGQFVPEELGLRHQTDVELKWGVHGQGECRPGGSQANGVATTISILVRGTMQITFEIDGSTRLVTLKDAGDYVIFGPKLVHGWKAVTDAVIVSIRFPSIDVRSSVASAAKSRSQANSYCGQ